MHIIIDISENLYEAVINGLDAKEIIDLRLAIKNGTPLPKGHGRLIDADVLQNCEYHIPHDRYSDYMVVSSYDIKEAQTIIEADKEESEG